MLQRFDTASLPVVPWKNGGGGTREIVCRPESSGLDGFDWRVSIATIARSGPFSVFEGVDRVIMLLDGAGVRLQGPAGTDHWLDREHVPFAFAGDAALSCTLLGGASTDFNLMTRRGRVQAELRVLRAATVLDPTTRGLLLALRGSWQLHDAQATRLEPGEGLWWDEHLYNGRLMPDSADAALAWVHLNDSP